jgi:hypothetical protein
MYLKTKRYAYFLAERCDLKRSPVTLLFAGGSALGISSGDPMKEIVIIF